MVDSVEVAVVEALPEVVLVAEEAAAEVAEVHQEAAVLLEVDEVVPVERVRSTTKLSSCVIHMILMSNFSSVLRMQAELEVPKSSSSHIDTQESSLQKAKSTYSSHAI